MRGAPWLRKGKAIEAAYRRGPSSKAGEGSLK